MNHIIINKNNQLELSRPNQKLVILDINTISRISSTGYTTHIYLVGGESTASPVSLNFLEKLLSEHSFYKIHPSHLINKVHIKKIITGEADSVVMYDGTTLPLAKKIKNDFIAVMQDWAMQKMHNSIAV